MALVMLHYKWQKLTLKFVYKVFFLYLFCDVYDGGGHFCSIGVGFHLDLSFPQRMGNAHSIRVFPRHWRLVEAQDTHHCEIPYTDERLLRSLQTAFPPCFSLRV